MVFPTQPSFSSGFPMVFLWFSIFLWFSYGFPYNQRVNHGKHAVTTATFPDVSAPWAPGPFLLGLLEDGHGATQNHVGWVLGRCQKLDSENAVVFGLKTLKMVVCSFGILWDVFGILWGVMRILLDPMGFCRMLWDLPSGTGLHNYGILWQWKDPPCYSWENSLVQWPEIRSLSWLITFSRFNVSGCECRMRQQDGSHIQDLP